MSCISSVDSDVHTRRPDRARHARMRSIGIEVIRVTWRRMERDPFAVVADIAGAIARRMSPRTLALEGSWGARS